MLLHSCSLHSISTSAVYSTTCGLCHQCVSDAGSCYRHQCIAYCSKHIIINTMFLPLTSVTLYSLLLVFAIAIDYNPLVTNGTCYFKAGQQMADEYSPCGNAALSNYWCCQLGDACASENACFNFGSKYTLLRMLH